jgi:tetratricopeptide (TPR) repeat protein
MSPPAANAYDRLKREAWEAIKAGELRASLALYDEALAWAREHGEPWQVDRTACSRAGVLVELGEGAGVLSDLRQILLGNRDSECRFLAAYTLARAHDLASEQEKALFYARIANRQAAENGTPEQLSSSHNLIGNLLLSKSEFDGALEQFRRALEVLPASEPLRRAIVLDNLGYCRAIRGRYRKAFRDLFESVRLCVRLGARSFEANARLSLAYTYLQCERIRPAIRHATKSLALAESCEDRVAVKYGLFILGEAHKLAGNPLAARSYFRRLQQDYYPEAPNVPDLLLLLNVRSLVNLKA